MSLDTVDGGKVWIPQNLNQPKVKLRNIIHAVVCCVVTSTLIVFLLVSSINGIVNPSEPVSDLVQGIESEHTSMSAFSFFAGFIIFISIAVGFLITLGASGASIAKVPRKYVFGSIGAGVTLGLLLSLFMIANTKEPSDQKPVINAWMQENYNYSLVEVLPVNQEEDIHALLDTGEEKFVVKDIVTGEEKTVHYYKKKGDLYLATDDHDFVDQMQKKTVESGENE